MSAGRPESLSAVTLGVTDMAASCAFYGSLGFELVHGGADTAFTSFAVGSGFLNLQRVDRTAMGWGRFIIHVDDVDAREQVLDEALGDHRNFVKVYADTPRLRTFAITSAAA